MGLTEERIQKALIDSDAEEFSAKERQAFHYAEDLVIRRTELGDARYTALREHFSEAELVELGVFIGLCIGFDTLISTWGLTPEVCAMVDTTPVGWQKMDRIAGPESAG